LSDVKQWAEHFQDFLDLYDLVLTFENPALALAQLVEIRKELPGLLSNNTAGQAFHHGMPQRLQDIFAKGQIENIDEFGRKISTLAHRRLHGGTGFDNKWSSKHAGSKGGMWSALWRTFTKGGNAPRTGDEMKMFNKKLWQWFGLPGDPNW
jgi:hypothetical protein